MLVDARFHRPVPGLSLRTGAGGCSVPGAGGCSVPGAAAAPDRGLPNISVSPPPGAAGCTAGASGLAPARVAAGGCWPAPLPINPAIGFFGGCGAGGCGAAGACGAAGGLGAVIAGPFSPLPPPNNWAMLDVPAPAPGAAGAGAAGGGTGGLRPAGGRILVADFMNTARTSDRRELAARL